MQEDDLQDEEFSKLFRGILELTLTFLCTLGSEVIGLIGMLTTQYQCRIYQGSLLLVMVCTISIVDH